MPSKSKPAKPADPKTKVSERIQQAKVILAKQKEKPLNDPKRRLAQKRLKRSQRALGEMKTHEKRIAAAKAKAEKPAE